MLFKKYLASVLSGALVFSPLCVFNEHTMATQTEDELSESKSAKKLIESGFYIPDEYRNKQTVSIDILCSQNLNTALKKGMEFILDDKESAFIDKKQDLNRCILENDLLCDYIKKVIELTNDKEMNENDKQFQILKKLYNMKNFMKVDENIPESNNFFKFISAMEHAYKTVISRNIANDIITSERSKIESVMGSQNAAAGANISGSANIDGVNVGISIGVESSESSSETSFYTIDSSAKLGMSVGAGLQKYLSSSVQDTVTFTHSLILYSLEQFLDSSVKDGKLSSIKLREPDIKKIIKSRQEMQKNEKELISLMRNSIEWYLKASETIPQDVNIKWPDITIAKSPDKQRSVNLSVSANTAASCLATIGMEVSADAQKSNIYAYSSYLNLIEKNCAPSHYGENAETISKFLNQDKTKKYAEIKELVDYYFKKHPNLNNDEKDRFISTLISNLTGDIRMYNNALSVLANEGASKEEKSESEKTKKETEKNWISPSKVLRINKGRLEILKTAVALSAYLFELGTTDKNEPLFEKLYNEMEHLAKMQAFSKNKSKQKAEYSTSRKCYSSSVNGKSYLKIPIVGTTALNIGYTENVGDASFDTNQNILVQMQIPMIGDKILGANSIRENFKKIVSNTSKIKNNPFAPEMEKAVSLLDSNFENILKQLGAEIPVCVPGYFSVGHYMLLNLYFTKTEKPDSDCKPNPLPGDSTPITPENDEWVLKLIKRIDTVSPDLNLEVSGVGKLGATAKIGKASSIIGNNTLAFLTNKFNALSTGINENSNEENPIWQDFKKAQAEEFSNLFTNISQKTNARYELQCIWNSIKNNIASNQTQYDSVYNDFKGFLDACESFNNDKSQENFDNASSLFDKVLALNYKLSYLPEFQKVHSIK